jgi:hypothetical protein
MSVFSHIVNISVNLTFHLSSTFFVVVSTFRQKMSRARHSTKQFRHYDIRQNSFDISTFFDISTIRRHSGKNVECSTKQLVPTTGTVTSTPFFINQEMYLCYGSVQWRIYLRCMFSVFFVFNTCTNCTMFLCLEYKVQWSTKLSREACSVCSFFL